MHCAPAVGCRYRASRCRSSLVAASRDDPLGSYERIEALANDWGSRVVDLGHVGHLNPASGYGHWGRADTLIDEISAGAAQTRVARA